jgi:hypothetical protein
MAGCCTLWLILASKDLSVFAARLEACIRRAIEREGPAKQETRKRIEFND